MIWAVSYKLKWSIKISFVIEWCCMKLPVFCPYYDSKQKNSEQASWVFMNGKKAIHLLSNFKPTNPPNFEKKNLKIVSRIYPIRTFSKGRFVSRTHLIIFFECVTYSIHWAVLPQTPAVRFSNHETSKSRKNSHIRNPIDNLAPRVKARACHSDRERANLAPEMLRVEISQVLRTLVRLNSIEAPHLDECCRKNRRRGFYLLILVFVFGAQSKETR